MLFRRFRLLLLALTVAGLTLTLPVPALGAGDFKFSVIQDVCKPGGGDFDKGHHRLKVRVEEQGKSGATKFTLDAKVLPRKQSGGDWTREFKWDRFKVSFPNDTDSYFHERYFDYDPNDNGLHKVVVVIRVWAGQTVLASRTLTGSTC